MTSLAQQQEHFVDAVFGIDDAGSRPLTSWRQGLSIYRRNVVAVAEAALAVSFPVLYRLMEQADFRALSVALLRAHPPVAGDWGEWGAELPTLLAATSAGRQFRFLAPMARLDWQTHRSARAADNQFDPASLALLTDPGIDRVGITLAAHVGLLESMYPLLEIRNWQDGQEAAAGEFVVASVPRAILVYRQQYRVEHTYMNPRDHVFLNGLRAGRAVGSLLDELANTDFDFALWLERALRQNLIQHFYPL
ncbi:MAG: putative DNA-binding domain-containing protein [Haliea sp.]|uniref:HvfC/BufC family peptide modification chaperone n=1 Tax=Haliea sp. TaxID=1932666 RepID=UPI0032ED8ED6